MSVETICNAIQDAIAGSSLITSAPHIANWPAAINTADLPIVLTRPGPGSWPHDAIADIRQHRTFISEIYVRPNNQGIYAEGITETLAIIQSLGALLAADYQLSGAAFDSEPSDRGLVILTYGGMEYRGTVFEMEVIEDVTG